MRMRGDFHTGWVSSASCTSCVMEGGIGVLSICEEEFCWFVQGVAAVFCVVWFLSAFVCVMKCWYMLSDEFRDDLIACVEFELTFPSYLLYLYVAMHGHFVSM